MAPAVSGPGAAPAPAPDTTRIRPEELDDRSVADAKRPEQLDISAGSGVVCPEELDISAATGADCPENRDDLAGCEGGIGTETPSCTQEQTALLAWGEQVRRDLPWRRTRDPWAILLAEVMAQQTQVDRVVPRWHSFLERWPTATAFAAAPLADVLDAWAGLGYPRRARNLWSAAQQIRDEHGGAVPADLGALLALPGVGPYTARAVLAFAHELDAAVVDTNVGRVLARRAGRRLGPAAAQTAAQEWLPIGHAWAWNQTLIDLGALRCRPVDPGCGGCPVAVGCSWFAAGRPEPDPARGSAGVSTPQAAFEGSRRQARGRLLDAARSDPVPAADWIRVVSWTDRDDGAAAAAEVAASLVADGLAELDESGALVLPRV